MAAKEDNIGQKARSTHSSAYLFVIWRADFVMCQLGCNLTLIRELWPTYIARITCEPATPLLGCLTSQAQHNVRSEVTPQRGPLESPTRYINNDSNPTTPSISNRLVIIVQLRPLPESPRVMRWWDSAELVVAIDWMTMLNFWCFWRQAKRRPEIARWRFLDV